VNGLYIWGEAALRTGYIFGVKLPRERAIYLGPGWSCRVNRLYIWVFHLGLARSITNGYVPSHNETCFCFELGLKWVAHACWSQLRSEFEPKSAKHSIWVGNFRPETKIPLYGKPSTTPLNPIASNTVPQHISLSLAEEPREQKRKRSRIKRKRSYHKTFSHTTGTTSLLTGNQSDYNNFRAQ